MKNTALFVDYENIVIAARNRGISIDWLEFREYLASDREGRGQNGAFCYVPIDPRNMHAKDRDIDRLWEDGWLVRTKTGATAGDGRWKCNMDVEMAMDMIFFANDARPDIVVMVTGDQDFAPVAIKLRERGIRVEVAAFPETVSKVLLNACSGYINLEAWMEGTDDDEGDNEGIQIAAESVEAAEKCEAPDDSAENNALEFENRTGKHPIPNSHRYSSYLRNGQNAGAKW